MFLLLRRRVHNAHRDSKKNAQCHKMKIIPRSALAGAGWTSITTCASNFIPCENKFKKKTTPSRVTVAHARLWSFSTERLLPLVNELPKASLTHWKRSVRAAKFEWTANGASSPMKASPIPQDGWPPKILSGHRKKKIREASTRTHHYRTRRGLLMAAQKKKTSHIDNGRLNNPQLLPKKRVGKVDYTPATKYTTDIILLGCPTKSSSLFKSKNYIHCTRDPHTHHITSNNTEVVGGEVS